MSWTSGEVINTSARLQRLSQSIPASYKFWIDSSESPTLYRAESNLAGEQSYNDENFPTVFQSVLDNLPLSGAKLAFANDLFEGDTTVTIPNEMHCLTLEGTSGFGKTYSEGGGAQGTHFKWSTTPMINNNYTNDTVHSIAGISFDHIKFEGPNTAASIGFDLKNADVVDFSRCTFTCFGYPIKATYASAGGYPINAQPGSVHVRNSIFSENRACNIYLERCTDNYIGPNNFFYGWGDFTTNIHLKGCNHTRIHNNTFQVPNPQTVTEHIKLESIDATYPISHIDLNDNWAWLEDTNVCWIRTATAAQEVSHTTSLENHIHHGYTPNELTDSGYIILASETNHQITANDKVYAFCAPQSTTRDHSSGAPDPWADDTTRQNKWNPMEVLLTEDLTNAQLIEIQMSYSAATIWSVLKAEGHSAVAQNVPITFTVPTLAYWKVKTTGAPTQVGLVVTYK